VPPQRFVMIVSLIWLAASALTLRGRRVNRVNVHDLNLYLVIDFDSGAFQKSNFRPEHNIFYFFQSTRHGDPGESSG